jgi:N-acetylmuramic acid 6-phosphate etherase
VSEQNYNSYATEAVNEKSFNIDKMNSRDIVRIINEEDQGVALAVSLELDNIALAIDEIAKRLKDGGRLIYIGAGTSGRLGVIDATEIPPTYGASPTAIQGIIAGGRDAMFRSSEATEDNPHAAIEDLKNVDFTEKDVCCGISASGSAAYVIQAIKYANSLGALSISLSCHADSQSAKVAQIAITPITGPEVITGSTRMKAGTAQKMVLNMISTGVMIKLGKVWHNMMVCMAPTNRKLMDRAARIISFETGVHTDIAETALTKCNGSIIEAISYIRSGSLQP